MSSLRNSIINQILKCLEYGDFCEEDFDYQFPDSETSTSSILAKITFKALPKYTFILDETYSDGYLASIQTVLSPDNNQKVIRTIEIPGTYKNRESRTHESIDSAIGRILVWVESIRDDLINSKDTFQKNIDELTENFQKSVDQTLDDPESYFEDHEADVIKKKLDELQNRISELELTLGISTEETKELEKAIEKSKSDLKVYPKGVWYKTAGTKLLKVLKGILQSKEGREIISDLAKKLLQ